MGFCPSTQKEQIVACRLSQVAKITPARLIEMWRTPKKDNVENDYRIITYNYGLAWRGLVVFFGIPLPLVVPLGHNESSFYFQGEHLIRVEYVYNWLDAAICGLHSEGPNGFGCIADWH
jgi:hypothetical protein